MAMCIPRVDGLSTDPWVGASQHQLGYVKGLGFGPKSASASKF